MVAEKGHSILPISVFPVLTFPISAFPILMFPGSLDIRHVGAGAVASHATIALLRTHRLHSMTHGNKIPCMLVSHISEGQVLEAATYGPCLTHG